MLGCGEHRNRTRGAIARLRLPPTSRGLIQTTIHDKYSGSIKIATHLDHSRYRKTPSGTNWSNRWTYRFTVRRLHVAPRCQQAYRGTSLIRNSSHVGPYIRTMSRALCGSREGGCFSRMRYSCNHFSFSQHSRGAVNCFVRGCVQLT